MPRPLAVVRRTAWLLLGAAIGLAAAVLGLGLSQVLAGVLPVPAVVLGVVCLLPVPLLGLVPGVRELEVTAARSMLGATEELVVPEPPRAAHRWRTIAWVALHLVGGLIAAVLVFGLVPGAVATGAALVSGSGLTVAGVVIPPVTGPLALAGALLAVLAVVAGCLAGTWLLGRAARAAVPTFLGPTAADRLQVAEQRLRTEAEYARLARELHDGIGHALTVISVQAAAGRRVPPADPAAPTAPLAVIESTARQALVELDGMLGVLRRDSTEQPSPGLEALESLVELHRRSGMELTTDVASPASLPALVSQTAYRIVGEGLTNAQRYAAPGPVELAVRAEDAELRLAVSSALRSGGARRSAVDRRRPGGGRGLDGVGERVRLFGGRLDAGPTPDGRRWVLTATIPIGAGGD